MSISVSVSQDGKQMTIVCDIIKVLSTSQLNYKVVESGGFAKVVTGKDGKPLLIHGQPLSLAVNATIPNSDMPEKERETKKMAMKLEQSRRKLAADEAKAQAMGL